MDQDGTWHGDGPRSRPHYARWDPALPLQKGTEPQFSAHFYSGQTAGCIEMPLGTEVGLGPSHIVLYGHPAPPPTKMGHSPQFLPHVYCGQTAGWTKMPLGMQAGHSPGEFVLDGDPAPPRKKAQLPPNFRPMSVVANRLDGEDATWYGSRPRPGPIVLDVDPAPPAKGAQQSPLFRPMSIVVTVAHLSYC